MNGGVLFETNAHIQLAPAPGLKQELITEHYAITAKRHSQKDKERCETMATRVLTSYSRMNRPGKLQQHTTYTDPTQPASYTPTSLPPPQLQYPQQPYPQQGYYQAPGQYYVYPSSAPVPGPSRTPLYQQPFQYEPTVYTASSYDAGSVSSASISSHKRKRSGSSQMHEELRTPRKSSAQPLPDSSSKRRPPASTGTQLPTPPSTGDHVSTPTNAAYISPYLSTQPLLPEKRQSGVYVTATEEEGRKLGLIKGAGASAPQPAEDAPAHGPPRTKPATILSVDASGVATLGNGNVLESDLELIAEEPRTPKRSAEALAGEPEDTPRTHEDKVKRRLSAFKTTSRPVEPMYSIRLDLGQGGATRVALRKDIALAFIGVDKTTAHVVEETRGEDEDIWAASGSLSRAPVRPDWPDDDVPWRISRGGRRAKQMREDRERTALLRRYLETSSDDDDTGTARVPLPARTRRSTDTAPGGDPTDARAALWFAMQAAQQHALYPPSAPAMVPNGVIACMCRNTNGVPGEMVACSSCKTWHHLSCVGIEDVSLTPNWVCDPCVHQARRATTTLCTPSNRTPRPFGSNGRFPSSAFRGDDQALALAPSPMFPETANSAASGPAPAQTPQTPSRRRDRSRVISYGNEWGLAGNEDPSTPAPQLSERERFSTPWMEDPNFDVNSTPSRHLSTDPRMAGQLTGSLFAITPLVGRSRNISGPLIETPFRHGHARNLSSVAPFSDGVVNRHEFLQGLTADRREGPGELRRPQRLGPPSPSPYGQMGLGRPKRFSHVRSGSSRLEELEVEKEVAVEEGEGRGKGKEAEGAVVEKAEEREGEKVEGKEEKKEEKDEEKKEEEKIEEKKIEEGNKAEDKDE